MPREPVIRISLSQHNPELASAIEAALAPDASARGHVRFRGGPVELVIIARATTDLIGHATAFALVLRKLLATISKLLGRKKRQVWVEHEGSTFVIRTRGGKKTVEFPDGKKRAFRSAAQLAKLIGEGEGPKRRARKH